eukprot:1626127-Amphidinium_carterae.1
MDARPPSRIPFPKPSQPRTRDPQSFDVIEKDQALPKPLLSLNSCFVFVGGQVQDPHAAKNLVR